MDTEDINLREAGRRKHLIGTERVAGIAKWFSNSKGYGFISRDGDADLFVHYSSIQTDGFRTLGEGQCVEFSIERSPQGLQATNVVTV